MPDRRLSDLLYERHQELLQPLMEFLAARGRLPADAELANAAAVSEAFGSLKRAYAVVRRVTGDEQWSAIEEERRQDLTLYLALARFDGRPRVSQLPPDLQLDVRSLFGNYTKACGEADRLLFSVGDAAQVSAACDAAVCGKITHDAIYVHRSALEGLPAILRAYEGCARGWVGYVEPANIVKLSRRESQVSYLWYPDFETDPHPALHEGLVVSLHGLSVKHRYYAATPNPPILHRKELFLAPGGPLRERFARLTEQEEKAGLLDDATNIGTRLRWAARLEERGYVVVDHRLARRREGPSTP